MNYSLKSLEPVFHVAFWVLMFALSFSTTGPFFSTEDALLLTLLRVLTLITIAYIHLWVIIPHFFRKGQFIWYSLAIVGLIVISVLINAWIFELWDPMIAREFPRKPPTMPPGGGRFRLGGPFPQFFLTFATLFFTLVYALGQEFRVKEKQASQLEKEKIKYELNFLRSQINPHFLFNALNNLHATVQLNPELAGDYVLKLGDMLRYVLEECKKEKVRLSDEINYIRSYIFFQQKKDSEWQNLEFTVSGEDPSDFEMEPMLLIALVENAFIHSYTEDIHEQFVVIEIHLREEEMRFSIRNNLPQNTPSETQKTKHHNIGLKNVKRRLELLYPDTHEFSYGSFQDEFRAKLMLKRNHEPLD